MDPFARAAAPRPTSGTNGHGASSTTAASSHTARRPRGVRRRRDDNASALEIEELDSDVMRQNSYNYFQRHGVRLGDDPTLAATTSSCGSGANPNEGGGEAAVPTSTSSRKRQRTLAEQLENLCLNGAQRSPSAVRGAAAAAACRQAWNRVFATQMAAAQQRAAAEKAAKATTSSPPVTQAASPASATSADVDVDMEMDVHSAASSAAEDGDFEDADDEAESGRESGSFKVFGGVPDVKDLFFSQGTSRHRPMERMFRHYVTMAADRSSRPDTGTPRGDELVLFQQGPTSLEFPYSLFTPEQVEDLRARHNSKKKKRGAGSCPLPLGSPRPSSSGFGSDQSWRFQELDSSDEADVSSSADDSDMDMSGDGGDHGKTPQLAGALSHGEWFVSEEEEEEEEEDEGNDEYNSL